MRSKNYDAVILSMEKFEQAKDFWLERLGKDIYGSGIRCDFSIPGDYEIKEFEVEVDNPLSLMLSQASKNQDIALYVILSGVLKVLLYKYAGLEEIVTGSPAYIRDKSSMVLNCAVPVIGFLNDGMSFGEVVNQLKQTISEGYKNQHYPFEKIIEMLRDRNGEDVSIFNTVLALDGIHHAELVQDIKETFKSSMILTFYKLENGQLKVRAEYDSSSYIEATIKDFLMRFMHIAKQVLNNSSIKLSEIELITDEDKRRILFDFNDTDALYPRDKTIHRLFEEQVDRTPDNTALLFDDEAVSYRELDLRANRVANYLIEEHGVVPDTLVGILMDKSIDLVTAALGVLKAGCAYVPVDPSYPKERIRAMLDDAGIGIVISGKKCIKMLNRLQWECKAFKTYLCMDSGDVHGEAEEASDLASRTVWEYVGSTASDDIEGGAWVSSYTGEPLTKAEMDEYSDNILKKLMPYLTRDTRVLEIGCASGLSMFKIAPFVGFYYGTDLSGVIIQKNQRRIEAEGIKNIKLDCMPAHEIDSIDEKDFDIVIMNSVVQCFDGNNYLRNVIKKAAGLMRKRGKIFVGDVMDEDRRPDLIRSLTEFRQSSPGYRTKTDWSVELFLAKGFFEDLTCDIAGITGASFLDKIFTIENELTRFRYDVILEVDKESAGRGEGAKHKHQHGADKLKHYERPHSGAAPHNAAYVIYTSGTTGVPKGAVIEHRNVVRLMFNDRMQFDFGPHDVWTMFHSFCFDFSVWEMYGALLYGGGLVIVPKVLAQDTKGYLKLLKDKKVTVLNQTPTAFYRLANEEMSADDSNLSLRYVIFGGEALQPLMLKEWRERYRNTRLINMYGITETTVHVTFKEITEDEISLNISNIGKPIPTLTAYIMDKNLKLLPQGVAGELCVGGDGVARGYLNRPELTDEKFVDNPYKAGERIYRSGDLARFLRNGDIEYLGRIDHQVKIRGFRIELGEIESRLLLHDIIRKVVVIVKKDETESNYLCAYIVSDREFTVSELRDFLSGSLPDYMIPSYFIRLDEIPMTANGKVDRRALPDPGGDINTGNKYTAPRNRTEEKLGKLWQEILGVSRIGIYDDFFELGGHSLKATTLVSRIHRDFDVDLSLTEVFKTPTIEGLARCIEGMEKTIYSSIGPIEERPFYPLSSAQKRMFVLRQFEDGTSNYNMSEVLLIEGDINVKRMEDSIKKLIQRHESLRTSFELVDEQPVQRVHKQADFKVDIYVSGEEEASSLIEDFVKPFDLGSAPLLRVGLIKLSDSRSYLLFDMHHIISDGISMSILIQEFMELYEGGELPEITLGYKDFSHWQNELIESGAIKKQEEYWLDVFSDEIPVLDMPLDFPRPPVQSFEGKRIYSELDSGITKKLYNIAAETGSTIYMVLMAVFTTLLHKYTGQEDIVVGSPIAGRPNAALENVIGMFVNTLAMRNFPKAQSTFREFLLSVRKNALDAYDNQDFQFDELVEKIGARRDFSRNPVFDVMFALQNFEQKEIEFEHFKVLPYNFDNDTARFDLTLNAVENSGVIALNLEYCEKLFTHATAQRILDHLINTASRVSENPDIQLSEIDMMSRDERDTVLNQFNDTFRPYPKDKTIHALFEEQVAKTPERTLAVSGGNSISYAGLNARANCLAGVLRQRGVARDTIVGIMPKRSIEMIIGIMAILKAGGAYLPIDPSYPDARIRYMLEDSNAGIILTHTEFIDRAGFAGEVINLDNGELYNGGGSNIENINKPEDLAYVIYTSGSTGKPKGVMVEHKSLVNLCFWHKEYYSVNEEDRCTKYAEFGFDASVWEIFPYIISGAAVYMVEDQVRYDVEGLNEFMEQNGITVSFLPTQVCEQFIKLRNKSLKRLLTGGDRLKYFKETGYTLYNNYGPTENTVVTTSCAVSGSSRNIPIGRPISNTKVYIVDGFDMPVPVGIPGELCIGGDGLARGYLKRPELTAGKFVANPFMDGERLYRTGDLARWLPDGNIEFLGRMDQQVKIRGFRIELGEIESRLAGHESVREAVVLDMDDDGGNKCLCAFVVYAEDAVIDINDLREFLREELPDYMIPAFFVKLDHIPMTPNNKIDKKALPLPSGVITGREQYVEPVTEIEKILSSVWSEILGIPQIGVKDNFFELGGDSIKAIQIAARLNKYNLKLDIRDLMLYKTIEQLSGCVRTVSFTVDQGIVSGNVDLSPIQKWFFEKRFTDMHHWNQAVMLYSGEGFEDGILRRVLEKIVTHHDALRLIYKEEGNSIVQYNRGIEGELFTLNIMDLTSSGDYMKAVQDKCSQVQSSISLENGPVIKACLFKTINGQHLLVAVHHLAIDGVSWRILLEDMVKAYHQAFAGEEILLQDKTHSFMAWVKRLNEYATSARLLSETEFWRCIEDVRAASLPKDFSHEDNRLKHTGTVSAALSREDTEKLLKDTNRAYNTEINDILITALGLSIGEWTNEDKVVLDMEGHGRENLFDDMDISRTVGWFTSMYPVVIAVTGSDLAYQIKAVKECLRHIPNKGIGYGVLRYLTPPCDRMGLEFGLTPEIGFNYLGQLDGDIENELFGMSDIPYGEPMSPESERLHTIDYEAVVADGSLVVNINYSKNQYREETVSKLSESFIKYLQDIINHCASKSESEKTPSDLDYKGLTIDELDTITDFFESM